jgi:hypothetical protein
MRSLFIAAAAAATLALPATAGAAETRPPEACDVVKNTVCHYLPPTSVEDVCGIVNDSTFLTCTVAASSSRASAGPDIPTSSCELQEKLGIVNVRACEDPNEA